MRAVVTACRTKFSEKSEDYATFDEQGNEIEAADWEQYCYRQSGPWIDVWVRLLSTTPQSSTQAQINAENESDIGSQVEVSRKSKGGTRILISEPANKLSDSKLKMSSQAGPRGRRTITTSSVIPKKSGIFEQTSIRKSGRNISTLSRTTRGPEADEDQLPPNRVSRFVVEPTSSIVNNSAVHDQDSDNLLFRKTVPSKQYVDDKQSASKIPGDTTDEKAPILTDSRSAKVALPPSTSVQVARFFQWPTGDTESISEDSAETQFQDDLDNILTEVHDFLSRGHLGNEDDRRSQEHFAKRYKSYDTSPEPKHLNEVINKSLRSHQPRETNEDTVAKLSWQGVLYEIIRGWDAIVESFCPTEQEHTILRSFRSARATFFKVFHFMSSHVLPVLILP